LFYNMQQPTTTSDAVTAVTDIALYNIFASQQGNSKMNVPRPCLFLNADGGVCKVAAAHGAYGCHNHSESTHQNPSPFGKMLSEMARGQSLLLKDANVMNAFVALSKTVAAIGLPHLSSIPLQKVAPTPAPAPMDQLLALFLQATHASQQGHFSPPQFSPPAPVNPFVNAAFVPSAPAPPNPFALPTGQYALPTGPYAQPQYAAPTGQYAQVPYYTPTAGPSLGPGGLSPSKVCGRPTKSGSPCKKMTGEGHDACAQHE
jgi:hypothetical protein